MFIPHQKPLLRWLGLGAAGTALLLGLAACNRNTEDATATAGQKVDQAVARAEQKSQQAGQAIERQADKAAKAMDDASVTAAVKAALIKEPDLKSLAISVDTKDGAVVLKGEVKSMADKQRAEQVASSVSGVSRVDNQLQVAG